MRIKRGQAERHHDLRIGIDELVVQLTRRGERAEIHHAPAGHQDAEKADDEMRRIREMQPDMHPWPHAQRLKALGGARRQAEQLAVGESAVIEVDGDPIGPSLRRLLQHILDRRRRRQRLVPGQAGWIGFFPDMLRHGPSSPSRGSVPPIYSK